jgi:hypothetical protein
VRVSYVDLVRQFFLFFSFKFTNEILSQFNILKLLFKGYSIGWCFFWVAD